MERDPSGGARNAFGCEEPDETVELFSRQFQHPFQIAPACREPVEPAQGRRKVAGDDEVVGWDRRICDVTDDDLLQLIRRVVGR